MLIAFALFGIAALAQAQTTTSPAAKTFETPGRVPTKMFIPADLLSGPLHSVADGQNGVFADAGGSFPTQSFSSSNYFVNVEVLDDGVPAAPTLASTSPVNGATRVGLGAAASAVVTRDLDVTTVTSGATLERSDGAPVAAAVAYDSASRRITITPAAQLDPLTTYVARLSTTVDAADGTPLAGPVSWPITWRSAKTGRKTWPGAGTCRK